MCSFIRHVLSLIDKEPVSSQHVVIFPVSINHLLDQETRYLRNTQAEGKTYVDNNATSI